MTSGSNLIDIKKDHACFKIPGLNYLVSGRYIRPWMDVTDYLRSFYVMCSPCQITGLFGNTYDLSPLYGGRALNLNHAFTRTHLKDMKDLGITLALTLTNHYFDEDAYEKSRELLEKHHDQNNAVICTHDKLAARIRADYPRYQLKASIIKNLNTTESIEKALDLYDAVTLPMDKNDDDDFLMSLPDKERIILFGNATCAYTCPARTCYLGFSQQNSGREVTSTCSRSKIDRLDTGVVYFNVAKFAQMGFTEFKLVPYTPLSQKASEEAVMNLGKGKHYYLNSLRETRPVQMLCSYPKSGRTWLRFILANYFNLLYGLNRKVNLSSMFAFVPNDDYHEKTGIHQYRFSEDLRVPLMLASHRRYSAEQFDDRNVVFLLRSVPDTLVSDYFQHIHLLKKEYASIQEFIRSKQGVSKLCGYLNSWAGYLTENKVLILTYEQLQQNTEDTTEKLLSALNVPIDKNTLRKAVALSSFEKMKAAEKEKPIPLEGFAENSDNDEARRMRRGKAGGSADYLDEDDFKYIRERCDALLSDAAKTILSEM